MSRIAIIPARAGSQRIPGKNRRHFHGKPIIQYSIELALNAAMFQSVIVSTDDPEISALAGGLGCAVHPRPPELAADHIGTQEVAQHVLAWAKPCLAIAATHACVIYATAPMILPADLWRGIEQVAHRGRDFAFAVGAHPLRDAGQWYWGQADAFLYAKPLIGPNTAMIAVDEGRICDINTEADWDRALRMYEALYRRGMP